MLRIKINKDIDEYSEGMFLGLNIKEIGNFLIMAAASVLLIFLWSRLVPIIVAIYLSAPVIIIIALAGRKLGNMSIGELIKFIPVYARIKRGIEFSSTEQPENEMICMDKINTLGGENKDVKKEEGQYTENTKKQER